MCVIATRALVFNQTHKDMVLTFINVFLYIIFNREIVSAGNIKRNISVPCSRSFTCSHCDTPSPIVPASTIKGYTYNKHVVFMGDSVSAQVECDYRMALHEANATSENGKQTGAEFPSLNASIEYIKIGCPWYCNKTTGQENRNVGQLVDLVPKRTTHLVFHIGHHYDSTRLKNNIKVYEEFLSDLSNAGIDVIIRSMNAVHFKTMDGEYDKNINGCGKTKGIEGPILNIILEQLAQRVGGQYFDIYAVSDDPTVHPDTPMIPAGINNGSRHIDCRHVCQNCDMLRTWNSLLIRLF